MANNDIFSESLEILPLITKERTQRFELLQHLIPNLKQHIIISGESGIGKTLLLDKLYDVNSDVWQCCFVQGSAELSFEMIEAQLTKTLLRNKYASLESALHLFQEQHKKIVLIIDDAGLLVSGLMTILIDYAASQTVIKLIFSLTPEAQNAHRQTDKALDSCYLLQIPALNKNQCADFLRHLAAKPRTYNAIPIDEKLIDRIYRDTQGIPAKILADFSKLARGNQSDYSKWLIGAAGVLFLAIAIHQGIQHFKAVEEMPIETPTIAPVEKTEQTPVVQKNDSKTEQPQDIIIPEFQLDIEKGIVASPAHSQPENASVPVEKPVETIAEPEKVEAEKAPEMPQQPEPVVETQKIETVVEEPVKSVEPTIAFPKVEPAQGVKIQQLPEKSTLQITPISAPDVKKVDIKPIEKPAEVKKPEPVKVEPVKKIEPEKEKKAEIVLPQSKGHYALQLITLSSEAAVEAFQKKHTELSKNIHVVKSGNTEQPRFALMYGGFVNAAEATKARENLPAEFANSLPRKN